MRYIQPFGFQRRPASIGPGGIEIGEATGLGGRSGALQSDQEELKLFCASVMMADFASLQSDQEELKFHARAALVAAQALLQSDQEELKLFRATLNRACWRCFNRTRRN